MRLSLPAFLVIVLTASICSAASELRWRSDKEVTVQKQATVQTPAPKRAESTAETLPKNTSTALKFVRPGTPTTTTTSAPIKRIKISSARSESPVRQAAFEEEAPQLGSGRNVDVPIRSVIVNREDAADSFRSAQLPSTGTGTTGTPGAGNAPGTPFGDTPPEPAEMQTPQLETPTLPETTLPPPAPQTTTPQNNTVQPGRQQRQPIQQPMPVPSRAPIQPVLPSGPTGPEGTGPPAPPTPTATIEAESGKAKQSCEQSLKNLRDYTVDKVKLNIAVTGTEGKDYPFECSIDDGTQFKGRCWDQITYMWKASALCHKPLYFEDEQLERYGHSFTPCFQPFVSGAHFFCTLPVLPYCMGVEPPCECIYALGYYRPGSCAPYMCNPIPLSLRGAVIQAGAVWGAAAILP